ncbi:MAG TPA: hypothetical protein VFS43_06035 [Polyangiaceae bacterium]|nr:hypothetical protein [Polyangiaceae bacterium]
MSIPPRRLAPAPLALLAALSAAACAASPPPPARPPGAAASLDVRTLNIVDERGQTRLRLGAPLPGPNGQKRKVTAYGVQFLDASGREVGGLAMLEPIGVHGLCFDSDKGYESVCIGLIKEGLPEIVFRDTTAGPREAQERIALRVVDGVATIELNDGEGKPRIRLQVERDGRTRVEGLGPAPAAK